MSISTAVGKIALLCILLLCALYMLLPTIGTRESFVNTLSTQPESSMSIFKSAKNSADSDKQIKSKFKMLEDRYEMFIAHRCYQFKPNFQYLLIKSLEEANVAYEKLEKMVISIEDIKADIATKILAFQNKLQKKQIEGSVYAFVSQAPFYRDASGNQMTLQFTINDYLNKPYNILNGKSVPGNSPPIFVTVILAFTSYGKNYIRRPVPQKILDMKMANVNRKLASFESRNKLCFIQCKEHGTAGTFCGCATGSKPYVSTCLGPVPWSKSADQVEQASFVLGYKINPIYEIFSKNNTFAPAKK